MLLFSQHVSISAEAYQVLLLAAGGGLLTSKSNADKILVNESLLTCWFK